MPKFFGSPFFLIYLTVFVTIVSFSMVFPLFPLFAAKFQVSDLVIGVVTSSFALAQLLFSPFWGMMSDRFGRKPIIAAGLGGVAVSFFYVAAAPDVFSLFLSRFLQGVFAAATIPSARAYVADLTGSDQRVKIMGRLGASVMLGVVLGPAIGGLLAEHSLALPFFVSAAVAFANLLFVLLILPESVKEKAEKAVALRPLFSQFGDVWEGLRHSLAPLFIIALLWSFLFSNNNVAVPLLASEQFSLSSGEIGILFGLMGAVSAVIQFFLLSYVTRFLGNHATLMLGMLVLVGSFASMPFLPRGMAFLAVAVVMAGVGTALARPVITALVSMETSEKQGATMGTLNTFEAMGRMIGPTLGGFLFGLHFIYPFAFSSLAVLLALAFIFTQTGFLRVGHRT